MNGNEERIKGNLYENKRDRERDLAERKIKGKCRRETKN